MSYAAGTRLIRGKPNSGGLLISAEVTPHHFSLSDAMVQSYDPVFRGKPAATGRADLAAFERRGCGTAPLTSSPPIMRASYFGGKAPGVFLGAHRNDRTGNRIIRSLDRTGPREKFLRKQQLVEKMSVNPAAVLGISGGSLKTGAAADVIVFDPTGNGRSRRNSWFQIQKFALYRQKTDGWS